MRYFVSLFFTTLSLRLRSAKFWPVLLLMPLLALGWRVLIVDNAASAVSVGVVLPESGGDALWSSLEARNDALISFIPCDEDDIDRNVSSGRWDCGLIFPGDFEERLLENELERSIEVRIGPGSTVYPLVQETVSACLAELVSPVIAREFLREWEIPLSPEALQQRLDDIRESTRSVGISMTTLDGTPLQPPELVSRGGELVLCWLVCAVVLVRMLYGAADLGSWAASAGAGRFLPLRSAFGTLSSRVCAEGFLMAISGGIALLLLGFRGWGCITVFSYCLLWAGCALLLARFSGILALLPVAAPFVLVISFLTSSALMDLSLIFPRFSFLCRWAPSALFLRSCKGEPQALAILWGYLLVCWTLAYFAHRRTRPACPGGKAA